MTLQVQSFLHLEGIQSNSCSVHQNLLGELLAPVAVRKVADKNEKRITAATPCCQVSDRALDWSRTEFGRCPGCVSDVELRPKMKVQVDSLDLDHG